MKKLKSIVTAATALLQVAGTRPLKLEKVSLSDLPKNTQAFAKALMASKDTEVTFRGRDLGSVIDEENAPLYFNLGTESWEDAATALEPVFKKFGYKSKPAKRNGVLVDGEGNLVGQFHQFSGGAVLEVASDLSDF